MVHDRELSQMQYIDHLSKFEKREHFRELVNMRSLMHQDIIEDRRLQSQMTNKNDTNCLQLVFIVDAVDSDLEAMLEGTLEEDIEPFFFGCNVSFATEEQNERARKDMTLPLVCKKPLKKFTHELTMGSNGEKQTVTVMVYRHPASVKPRRLRLEMKQQKSQGQLIDTDVDEPKRLE